ncbi:hypothetical protein COO91_10944 (plasmid) [Nostoc flagelliforme CCNUN1]|uniref:Uncharacterized protein n=1 Tax=Nostoc flagelliforme CCNUN1 TaxID=2038116 RepID=A0A2K8TAI4_9NOSO|nr:hypothetical protein COO91_10944 [Nostoc flagelliforme CCNUN1]
MLPLVKLICGQDNTIVEGDLVEWGIIPGIDTDSGQRKSVLY